MILHRDHVARRVYYDPVCEIRGPDGRYCAQLAVSASLVPSGNPEFLREYRSRCRDHADPHAPLLCLACKGDIEGTHPTRCWRCAGGPMKGTQQS